MLVNMMEMRNLTSTVDLIDFGTLIYGEHLERLSEWLFGVGGGGGGGTDNLKRFLIGLGEEGVYAPFLACSLTCDRFNKMKDEKRFEEFKEGIGGEVRDLMIEKMLGGGGGEEVRLVGLARVCFKLVRERRSVYRPEFKFENGYGWEDDYEIDSAEGKMFVERECGRHSKKLVISRRLAISEVTAKLKVKLERLNFISETDPYTQLLLLRNNLRNDGRALETNKSKNGMVQLGKQQFDKANAYTKRLMQCVCCVMGKEDRDVKEIMEGSKWVKTFMGGFIGCVDELSKLFEKGGKGNGTGMEERIGRLEEKLRGIQKEFRSENFTRVVDGSHNFSRLSLVCD